MRNFSGSSLRAWIIMLTTLALLTSCGGKDDQDRNEANVSIIETAIPGVYFEIPDGALPAGLDPADVRIEPT